MKKKLLLLDLALAATVVVLAMQVRDKWLEAQKRSEVMFHQKLKSFPPPPHSPLPEVPSVTAASYSAVAMKYLFSADRNPTVIVEPPKEKPMPPLPVYYGMMSLSDGATVIMSAKQGEPSQGIHFGEKVGEFTLVDVEDDQVTLEWNNKTVTKKISELRPQVGMTQAAAKTSDTPRPAAQPQPAARVEAGPWQEVGPGLRACRPGDASPAGTTKDGWKKVLVVTPMGNACHWEQER